MTEPAELTERVEMTELAVMVELTVMVKFVGGEGCPVAKAAWSERKRSAEPSSGVECSHQSCVLWGLWSGQRWGWRNGACGVRTGARLTPLEWAVIFAISTVHELMKVRK